MTSRLRRKRPITPPNTPSRPATAPSADGSLPLGGPPAHHLASTSQSLAVIGSIAVLRRAAYKALALFACLSATHAAADHLDSQDGQWMAAGARLASGYSEYPQNRRAHAVQTPASNRSPRKLEWKPTRPKRRAAAHVVTRRPRNSAMAASSRSASTRVDPFEEDDRRQADRPATLPSDPFDIEELPPPIQARPAQDSPRPESQPFQLPSEQRQPDPPRERPRLRPRDDNSQDLAPLDRLPNDDTAQDDADENGGFGDCETALATVKANVLSRIDLDITLSGQAGQDFPAACAFGDEQYRPRHWPQLTYNWKASALCHKPLYFEDPQLERYGHEMGPYLQPFVSAAHFFGALPILPYKMGMKTPQECVYVLGYYRPGNCAPYLCEPYGFTKRAVVFETLAVLGFVFIVP